MSPQSRENTKLHRTVLTFTGSCPAEFQARDCAPAHCRMRNRDRIFEEGGDTTNVTNKDANYKK